MNVYPADTHDKIVHISIGKRFLNTLIKNMERLLRVMVDDDDSDISVERPELNSHHIIEIEEQIEVLKTKMDEIILNDEENARAYEYVPKFIITDEEENDFEQYQCRGLTMEDLVCDPTDTRSQTASPYELSEVAIPDSVLEKTLLLQETTDYGRLVYGVETDICGNFIRALDVGHICRNKYSEDGTVHAAAEEEEDIGIEGEQPVRSYTINNEMEGSNYLLYHNMQYHNSNYKPLTYFEMEDYKFKKYNMV